VKICPSCGEQNSERARFCQACASPLDAAQPAREERKVVTVLFCDLVGFTARSEQMDPEDVRALLRRYHEHLRSELQRFGGTVEKFIGDAVVAVFGAPTAHEDDPERAVRAALAIRDWAREQEGLELRIAANTGEALVALGADPGRGEGMVAGDVVNMASRLQAAAPVNGILVGETTYRATRERIDYREREPVELKGKAKAVAAWEAEDARSRVEVEQAARAPLVGRDEELTLLRETLARVNARREPQHVTLIGVPGIGKSRLVYELYRSIERGSELVYWRRGRSLPYGEGVAFWALGEIVKAQAGVLESDPAEVAEQKLRTAAAALLDTRDATWAAEHLATLVGGGSVADLGGDRREEAFGAWRRFLEALAEDRPLVLVFEDLHWADDGMLDFVDYLAVWAEGVPLLVLCTARPELLERRPAWGGGKVNAATLLLSPLSDDETARLVHELLGRTVLPAELQTALLERAGGNPLYAEEFVRLVEEEREDVELPESVQGIIAARLDLLGPDEKRLLQDAAVAGRTFWRGEVAAIGERDSRAVERALHDLARREFVQRERRSSVAGEAQYAFRHALVRDVAYGQIPRAERAGKHRRAAEWIESLGRTDDHSEVLAHHYVSALEYARPSGLDASALVPRARAALREAGERALALNAFSSAIGLFGAALDLWPDDDPAYPSLVFGFATALQRSGDERAKDLLERAAEALVAAGDRERAAEARTMLAELAWLQLDRQRCDVELARARDLVRDAPPSASVARVLSELSRFRALGGAYDEAIELGRRALAIAEKLGLAHIQAHALNNIGMARCHAGDPDGLTDIERSIEVAEAANSPEAARAYNNLGALLETDLARTMELLEKAVHVAERFGLAQVARYSRGHLLGNEFSNGRWDDYLARVEEFLAESERVGRSYQEIYLFLNRSELQLARGDEAAAWKDAATGFALARDVGDPQVVIPALTWMALLELETGNVEEASKLARDAVATAAGTGLVSWLRDIALYADRLGVKDELVAVVRDASARIPGIEVVEELLAGAYVEAAERLAREGYRVFEADVRLRAAEKLVSEGRRGEADVQLQQALAFWRSVGATRYIGEGERLLAASA
jgi:class 3 adenylate cyclase/tetratricopeptide (TPR) repeat protein